MVGQFPPHVGGVGVHIHTLSKKLVSEGHEVYVITYPHKDIKDIDGIHVIGTKGLNIPGVRGLMFKMNAKKALEELLEKEDIDIIHGHYLFPAGAAAVEVGKEHNIRTYVTAHGSDMFELYKTQPLMRSTVRKVLRDAYGVFAVSNALRHEIIATGVPGIADKTKVSWNSVDIDKFSAKENDSFKKENKLEDKLPSCDVLILPSFSESFGLVLIEALACGKPVIGSKVGGITEIINEDVGLLVNPNKISSISRAIDTLINDDDLRLVLSLNARNRAKDFAEVTIPYDEVK